MKKYLDTAKDVIRGIATLAITYLIFISVLNFVFSPSDSPEPKPTERYKFEKATPTESTPPAPTRKIVGYTSDDEPIYEDQIFIPEPTYYDEYGVKYVLREGTIDEYYVDEDYREEIQTPESSAFTKISYRPYYSRLNVEFRNSGESYTYYDVDPETWYRFKNAESKGSFFNEFIKGQFEYDRD